MQTDRKALLQNAYDCQALALGLLADEAADMGDVILEAGYRWMAANRCWPMMCLRDSEPREVWHWGYGRYAGRGYRDVHELPAEAGGYIAKPSVGSNEFGAVLEWGARLIGRWRMGAETSGGGESK